MFCYSADGLSMRRVDAEYTAGTGEVLFEAEATAAELSAAFPDYATARAAIEAAAANAVLVAQLDTLDAKSIRPLRAVLAATQAGTTPDAADLAKLAAIEALAQSLRGRLTS